MFTRVLTITVLGVAALLGAITVIAAPGAALGGAALGTFAGGWIALTGLVLLLGPVSGPTLLFALGATFSVWSWRHPERRAVLRGNPFRTAGDALLRGAQRSDPPRRAGPSPQPVPITPPVSVPADLSTHNCVWPGSARSRSDGRRSDGPARMLSVASTRSRARDAQFVRASARSRAGPRVWRPGAVRPRRPSPVPPSTCGSGR